MHLSQLYKKFCAGLPLIVALLLDVLVIIVMFLFYSWCCLYPLLVFPRMTVGPNSAVVLCNFVGLGVFLWLALTFS